MKKLFALATLGFVLMELLFGVTSASAAPWKFGVMSDTQWTISDDPAANNPDAVAVSIIKQINQQFINHGVKFVIQVGDLTENGNDADIEMRATAARQLYESGIGFFPMRGNHETYANPANSFGIPAFKANFPQTRGIEPTYGGANFSSPTSVSTDLDGMSYSFDYGPSDSDARFVILDNWATASKTEAPGNGYVYGYSIKDQQPWINSRLDKSTRGTMHAFVFSHQNLIGENHQDSLFTGYTDANPDWQNAFFASLQKNDVGYYISGHDHIHQRSIITSPNGAYKVQELICASDSSKFYTPKALTDSKWYGQKRGETSLSQELYAPGYYIFTVDGPRVTVDYYSDASGNWKSDNFYPDGKPELTPPVPGSHITPDINFIKKESWSYSLNGHEFLVSQGETYTTLSDRFDTTIAQILSGINGSTAKDGSGRPLTKAVNTGWTDTNASHGYSRKNQFNFASNIFALSGMADVGTDQTDVYTLSMTYNGMPPNFIKGGFGIASQDEAGNWVNAVDLNIGSSAKKFVLGPWNSSYGLGTYGIDLRTNSVWAIINYNGDFAVRRFGR
jgi:hypothetical protein